MDSDFFDSDYDQDEKPMEVEPTEGQPTKGAHLDSIDNHCDKALQTLLWNIGVTWFLKKWQFLANRLINAPQSKLKKQPLVGRTMLPSKQHTLIRKNCTTQDIHNIKTTTVLEIIKK